MLDNKAMLNVLIVIIFENTNLHNLRCVESTISELERWFVIAGGKSGSSKLASNSFMQMVLKRIKVSFVPLLLHKCNCSTVSVLPSRQILFHDCQSKILADTTFECILYFLTLSLKKRSKSM